MRRSRPSLALFPEISERDFEAKARVQYKEEEVQTNFTGKQTNSTAYESTDIHLLLDLEREQGNLLPEQ